MQQVYLGFKDKSKYNDIKYPLMISAYKKNNDWIRSDIGKIIVEFSNVTGNWHWGLPLEREIKEMEQLIKQGWKIDLTEIKKFSKDQKRKELTDQEFIELLEAL